MNIEKCEVMIFRYEGQYGANYSIGLSKKDKDGKYENGYIQCKFQKGVDIPNKTKIKIKDAWLTFNQKDKKTYPYIFIKNYELDEQPEENKKEESDPFEEFGLEIKDEDLPF